jgi:multiple sugar transport system ATP-binding protein
MATIALKNLDGRMDLTIRDREFVVLAGPGSEGSAIVRAVAGLAAAPQGEILFDDKSLKGIRPNERDVALLSHDYVPFPRLSVYENLALGLKQRRFGDAEIKKRIAAVAETLGIKERLGLPANSLSPAECRFVGLARVMVRQPRVFLFDRPFADLGTEAASRGRAAITELQQRAATTIIYATNNPAEALAFATRTVVIEGGSVQQDAEAQAIYDAPANLAVAGFFGDPPMNLVQGTLKVDREAVTFAEAGEGTIALALPRFEAAKDLAGQPVTLGFRPESIRIALSPDGANRPGQSFRALVERAEPRGSQTDLYLRTGAHELVCRTASWESQGGRRLEFAIEPAKTHLFSGENGLRLAR